MPGIPQLFFDSVKASNKQWGVKALTVASLFVVLMFSLVFYFTSGRVENLKALKLKEIHPDFYQRKSYLLQLEKDFLSHEGLKRCKRGQCVRLLWGKGGYGKSEIAIHFANLHQKKFSLIWTIQCDSKESIQQDIRQLANFLGVHGVHDYETVEKKVFLRLENFSSKKPWLLIFDNIDSIIPEIPCRGGAILMTSQKKLRPDDSSIEVKPFSNEDSIELLQKITHENRTREMEFLASDLENIPLLVTSAAYYIKNTPGYSVESYQKHISAEKTKKEVLWGKSYLDYRYQKNLSSSWNLLLTKLKLEEPLALKWAAICAYLNPENIPSDWLDDWLVDSGYSEKDALFVKRGEILKTLTENGLLRYEKGELSIHRFWQLIIKESRKNLYQEDLESAISLLVKYCKDPSLIKISDEYEISLPEKWKESQNWYLHALSLKKQLSEKMVELNCFSKQILKCFYQGMGNWCMSNLKRDVAYEDLMTSQKFIVENLPETNAEMANFNLKIAYCQFELTHYHEALASCNSGVALYETKIDQNALELAFGYFLKGFILWELGEYEPALACQKKMLEIRLRHYPENHLEIGRAFVIQSLIYNALEKYSEGIIFADKALKIFQKTCGKNHLLYAAGLQRKGWALHKLEKHKQAICLFNMALKSFKNCIGEYKNDLFFPLYGIAWCDLSLKKYQKAEKMFKKAEEACLNVPPPNLSRLRRCYHGMGCTYLKAGKIEEGILLLHKQLELSRALYTNTPRMQEIENDYYRLVGDLDPKLLEEALQKSQSSSSTSISFEVQK